MLLIGYPGKSEPLFCDSDRLLGPGYGLVLPFVESFSLSHIWTMIACKEVMAVVLFSMLVLILVKRYHATAIGKPYDPMN